MRRHSPFAACAALLLTALANWAPLPAASHRPLTLESMTGIADGVLVGSVVETRSEWDGDLIVTVATVRIEEVLKATAHIPAQLQIRRLGGTAVHPRTGLTLSMSASAQAVLTQGEEVLLFLERDLSGTSRIIGGSQGKFTIRTNRRTRAKEIPIGPKHLVTEPSATGRSVEVELLSLDVVRVRVRAAMGSPRGAQR